MKLSDYKGEEALDILCDLIEPVAAIAADEDVRRMVKSKIPKLKLVSEVIRHHKTEVLEIMAAMEREPVEEYAGHVNIFTLPVKLLEIVNDPQVMQLFTSQEQTGAAKSSASAPENTGEN